MFIRLLIISIFVFIVVQSTLTTNIKNKPSSTFTFPKQFSVDDDDDDVDYLNDKKLHNEGSSSNSATPDEYADEDDDDDDDDDNQLSKIIATTTIHTTISTTTNKRIMTKIFEQKKKNENNTKTNYLDVNEFYEDYKDDLEDDTYYNEPTIKTTSISLSSTHLSTVHPTSMRVILNFLTRPPIAAGILGGLAIGILTSVILLICIVQNYNKRDRTHSSITTGLLYPNQYGYSKTPQEFYA
ncbi:unnamed protein product [Rotaria sp. Silwood2]|nr:unnamed protein product [Rotaria sp. Silwood2]CAF4308444.1 unnamed protein product [Rotaria sp. Silwood2]